MKQLNTFFVLTVIGIFHHAFLNAQTYLMPVTGDTAYTTCSGTIYDDGGLAGNYSDNANGIISLIPSKTGSKIELFFEHFDLNQDGDTLNIYNYTYPEILSIGSYTYLTDSLVSSNAEDGSLTINLSTNSTGNATGFIATITCTTDTVQTNLGISNVLVTQNFFAPGSPVYLNVYAYNYSEIIVKNTIIGFYLSADNQLDAGDQLLDLYNMQYFAPNYSYAFYYELQIPSEALLGEHYIIVKIDNDDLITETNENDNIYGLPILIQEDPKDFSFISAYIYEGNPTTAGGRIRVTSDISYIGQTYIDTIYTAVFLSTDTLLDATDTLLSQRFSRNVYPNGYINNSFAFYLPESLDTGTYYLILFTDYYNRFKETNENNNQVYLPVKVTPRYADLKIYDLNLVNTILYRNITNSAQYVLRNNGNYNVSNVKTAFYLSDDYKLDESDICIFTDNMNVVNYNNYSYKTVYFDFKNLEGVNNGLYYLIIKTDATDSIEETNEDNNIYFTPIMLTDYYADIELTSIETGSAVMSYNYGFTITSVHKNLGPMEISSFYTNYYLSEDSMLNIPNDSLPTINDDIFLGRSYHYSLPAYYETSQTLELFLYDTLTAGTYYLIGIADQKHAVDQIDTANNIFITKVEVGEMLFDLEVVSAELPVNTVRPGSPFLVRSTVRNNSNQILNYTYVNCYISTDTIKDSSDTYISGNYLSRMAPGESRDQYYVMSIPNGFSEGNYYLLIYVDADNSIMETNETNNYKYLEISLDNSVTPENISPELAISGMFLENSVLSAGSRLHINGQVTNTGSSVTDVTIAYYLSEDTILDIEDLDKRLYEHQIYNLNTGTIYTINKYFNLPATLAKGDYYIIGKVDDYNIVSEDNEQNNIAFTPIKITDPTIDLSIGYLNLSSILLKGNQQEISFSVQNSGSSTSPSSQAGIYLLSYHNSDTISIQIGTCNIGSINSDNYNYYSSYISIPDTVEEGVYFLQVIADNLNEIQELNEENNLRNEIIGIMNPDIDYRIDDIKIVNPVFIAGSYFGMNYKVYNDGLTQSFATSVGYYLSADTIFNAEDDILIHNTSVSPLPKQRSIPISASYIQLPDDLSTGSYRLFLVIDYLNEIPEKSEDNNISFIDFTIYPPFVDLTVENLSLTNSTVTQGEQLYITCRIRNKGNSTATSSYTGFYLSPDTILDNSDLLLGYKYTYSLSSNDYSYESYNANIPSGYDTGQYFILVAADYQNAVNESDESNNVVYKSFKIIEQNIDLEITALGVNNNSMPAGSYCYINYTIRNNGLTRCTYTTTRFYLSKDTVLNPLEDTYLGNYSNYSIGAGSYDNNNAYITIPSTIKNDNYYLFAVADMLNEIKETNELNNSKRIFISVTESYIDLTITDATINSNSFQMYNDAYISFCLRNYGNIESPSGNIGYYISTDTVFDQNDILISQNYFSYIGPNNFTYVNRSVNIPYFPTFGQYFIIVVADNNNYIQEKSENNNTYIFPVTIVNQFLQPDLRGGCAIYNGYNLNMGGTLA
ncbi:MAG: CARDB domain-containing protein [Bacteroidales bacterium]